jgi:hypothetical protein
MTQPTADNTALSQFPLPKPTPYFAIQQSISEAIFHIGASSFLIAVFSMYVPEVLLAFVGIIMAFLLVGLSIYHKANRHKRQEGVAALAGVFFLQTLVVIAQKHYYA